MNNKGNSGFIYVILFIAFIVFIIPQIMYPDHLYFLNGIIKEGFNDFDIDDMSGEKSFCRQYKSTPHILNEKSKILTKSSCMNTDCTVWTSNELCVAGSLDGPVYSKVCLLGLQCSVMRLMSPRKPMSNMRSASSRMSTSILERST